MCVYKEEIYKEGKIYEGKWTREKERQNGREGEKIKDKIEGRERKIEK